MIKVVKSGKGEKEKLLKGGRCKEKCLTAGVWENSILCVCLCEPVLLIKSLTINFHDLKFFIINSLPETTKHMCGF